MNYDTTIDDPVAFPAMLFRKFEAIHMGMRMRSLGFWPATELCYRLTRWLFQLIAIDSGYVNIKIIKQRAISANDVYSHTP